MIQLTTSVMELKVCLGLLNFYNKFLPNLSTFMAPLHQLLREDELWSWGPEQEKAFKKSKGLLQSSSVSVNYDENKELILILSCGVLSSSDINLSEKLFQHTWYPEDDHV